MNAKQTAALSVMLAEPRGWIAVPAALLLVLVTAAATEEVFFRGVLQTRLADRFGGLAAWLLSTAAFALYHVPYRYLVPGRPWSGHLGAAFTAGLADGGFGGLILGGVFWRTRGNLLAAIAVHAAIDLLPATELVHRTWPNL
jgi:hypothetical protein